ncbi:MAG: ribonucleotide-diphosphate reductase subunit beta [Candidatus Riesia sp.]|nr:ribonucleotide-diphosphate reductase subunit beta [Candidatus Riesia sp.]
MSIFNERKNYKPFEYSHITDPMIYAMWSSHWTHREFNFKSDVQDFKTQLTEQEQGVVKRAVLLISQVEVAVKSYWSYIGKLLPKPEIADMGAVFGGVEVIHSRAYSEILDKLGLNGEFQKLLEEEVVKNRVTYLTKYVNKIYKNDKKNILYSLVLFTLFTEATSLFSQFYTLLGFNRFRGLFKDISNIVQYTSKEENLHMEGGVALINQIKKEHPELFDEELMEKVYEETKEAFEAEKNLIRWILQGYENEFISEEILEKYIKYRFNECLSKIGINKPFKLRQEDIDKFIWMEEEVLAPAITDFFYKKPIDYAKKSKVVNEDSLF